MGCFVRCSFFRRNEMFRFSFAERGRHGLAACCLITIPVMALSQEPRSASLMVFPGAVGFGVQTPAGTDGQVLRITNLKNSGPGSLRDALQVSRLRLIVFEVGGIIDLEEEALRIDELFLTIAGQTAPSQGITLIKGSLYAHPHNILVQHVRVRLGDAGHRQATDSFTPHGFRAFKGACNVVIDHCSFSWTVPPGMPAGHLYLRDNRVVDHDGHSVPRVIHDDDMKKLNCWSSRQLGPTV